MPPKGQPPRGGDRRSKLSEDERALWDHVTRDAEPLRKQPKRHTKTEEDTRGGAPAKPMAVKALARMAPLPAPPARKPKPAPPTLGHGDIADLDKRSAERMRRGRLPIEGTLDLHGHNQDAARRELADFLARAQGAGKRCVIVVTGKGDIAQGGGVLRAQVPRWLNDAQNRARVLAFDYAQPRHGGMGALYVLLRKTRETR
jgi:DNA-nicking Smr family endonuclease